MSRELLSSGLSFRSSGADQSFELFDLHSGVVRSALQCHSALVTVIFTGSRRISTNDDSPSLKLKI
jgi:hypothetical protein